MVVSIDKAREYYLAVKICHFCRICVFPLPRAAVSDIYDLISLNSDRSMV